MHKHLTIFLFLFTCLFVSSCETKSKIDENKLAGSESLIKNDDYSWEVSLDIPKLAIAYNSFLFKKLNLKLRGIWDNCYSRYLPKEKEEMDELSTSTLGPRVYRIYNNVDTSVIFNCCVWSDSITEGKVKVTLHHKNLRTNEFTPKSFLYIKDTIYIDGDKTIGSYQYLRKDKNTFKYFNYKIITLAHKYIFQLQCQCTSELENDIKFKQSDSLLNSCRVIEIDK